MNFNSLSKLEQKEIVEVLTELGLNEKDRAVYFALLSAGESSISPLSKTLNFPLTTIQSVLIRLDKRGLVNVGKRKTRHVYEANDPSVLKKILERKIEEVGSVIPLLNKIKSEEGFSGKVKIFYRERMSDIFHDALKSKDKMVYEIVSAKDFQEILGEKFHFTKRRKKEGVYLKSLRVEKHEIKKYNKSIHEAELREAKFLPAEMDFRASMMMWDDKVAFFTTKGEGLAWVVESKSNNEMFKQIFEMLWSVSRRMETI